MSIFLGNTEIGQIYLGSTEIATAYLGSTKVFDAGSGSGSGGELSDYVQDGLVLHLDAIDRGTADADKWINLKESSHIFTLYNCVLGTNYVQFDGTSSYGSRASNWRYSDATIEVVAIANADGFVYCERSGMMARLTTGTQFVFSNNASRGRITTGGVCNSANSSAAVVDGVDCTSLITGSDYGTNTSDVVTIGKRQASSAGFFGGKIYAIREYSRKLTVAEMIQNQKVDNIRFNLGLNIT